MKVSSIQLGIVDISGLGGSRFFCKKENVGAGTFCCGRLWGFTAFQSERHARQQVNKQKSRNHIQTFIGELNG